MKEIQIFYAPAYDYSVGAGHVELDSDETPKSRSITYARLNYLKDLSRESRSLS